MSKEKVKETLEEVFEEQEELDLSSIPEKDEETNLDSIDLENKKKQRRHVIFGILFIVLQAAISAFLMVEIIRLGILPNKFVAVIGVVLVILLLFTVLSQTSRNGRVVGRVYAIILAVVFAFGGFYIWRTNKLLDQVTNQQITSTIQDVRVVVLNDSAMTGLQDLSGKAVGIQKEIDRENTDQTIKNISAQLEQAFQEVEFEGYPDAINALLNHEVDAIIINQAFFVGTEVAQDYPEFDVQTKILESFIYSKPVEESSKPVEESSKSTTTEPKEELQTVYTFYLAGNDAYGEVTTTAGRNDVNILATINTETHTVLLTSTPRDYYVQLDNGGYDKLAHASILGLDKSIYVLENLYDVHIDYYVRVNFNGFEDIVNALGGVEVYSEYEFYSVLGFHYDQGYNYVNGTEALNFVRERKAFGDGDIQRGYNQMAMIRGIINKMLSPSILQNYLPLLDSISTCFATNIPRELISALVKSQIDSGAEWTVVTQSVDGEMDMLQTYSGGKMLLSVLIPDYNSVDEAIERIKKVTNGEPVDQQDPKKTFVIGGSQ